ncbi:hypothetical protein DPMN_002893 [Dreissena polymorpha]|uniref:Uncharacterized protein n=1 Tax=Dreissena polymorpha TaxID=45954 RepID=A0A9D4MJY5_DREPO|nr:hypothetical protein DPMN_002893 [Dreissena polymorpha]
MVLPDSTAAPCNLRGTQCPRPPACRITPTDSSVPASAGSSFARRHSTCCFDRWGEVDDGRMTCVMT